MPGAMARIEAELDRQNRQLDEMTRKLKMMLDRPDSSFPVRLDIPAEIMRVQKLYGVTLLADTAGPAGEPSGIIEPVTREDIEYLHRRAAQGDVAAQKILTVYGKCASAYAAVVPPAAEPAPQPFPAPAEKTLLPEGVQLTAEPRIGDREREAALKKLTEACAGGYLDMEQFDARSKAVTAARTSPEIMAVMGDLPDIKPAVSTAVVQPARKRQLPHPLPMSVTAILSAAYSFGMVNGFIPGGRPGGYLLAAFAVIMMVLSVWITLTRRSGRTS